ncbi:helix-turn-helix domain-containing protein [Streptomyces luteireticuli]|uniref:helix-turn-helix domain-containing protein n=1 Tax=Streptomyces luteireticuli TaxID=173858 RepID=UPI003558BC1F
MALHAARAQHLTPARAAGALIRAGRDRRDPPMTQADLGALVGYSASWVCRVEKGDLVPGWNSLIRIAEALGIPPDDLISAAHPPGRDQPLDGQTLRAVVLAAATVTAEDVEGQEESVRRRKFLFGAAGIGAAVVTSSPAAAAPGGRPIADPAVVLETALFNPPSGRPVSVPRLARALHTARGRFEQAHYADLAQTLPALLAAADATTAYLTGHHRELASATTSGVYALACELAAKVRSETAWVAADRARAAALASGQAAPQAEAARALSIAMRHAGLHQAALDQLTRTGTSLGDTGDPHTRAVGASLQLTTAYQAALTGNRSLATALLDEAEQTAARSEPGAGQRLTTLQATPAQCTAMRISVCNALGTPDDAVDHARRITPADFPTVERRARLLTDVARMWHQLGDHQRTWAALRALEHHASEEASRPPVRALTVDLLYAPVPLPGLKEFAARTHAVHG